MMRQINVNIMGSISIIKGWNQNYNLDSNRGNGFKTFSRLDSEKTVRWQEGGVFPVDKISDLRVGIP